MFAAGAARVVLFSVVPVCLSVSVSTITPEPLQISAQNFQHIILWSKQWTSLKMAV